MGIPIPTTRITVRRVTRPQPYEPATKTVVATGVNAHFSGPAASGSLAMSVEQSIETAVLLADPCDLRANDEVEDETTGQMWKIDGAPTARPAVFGFGAHSKAGVSRVTESAT